MKLASAKASEARRILLAEDSSALGVLAAVKELLGDCWHWEPETIWLELAARNCDPPIATRAKVQAGIALMFVPSFYWDGVVFEKTALAFDGYATNADRLEEASTAQLATAVEQAAQIVDWHGDHAWEFRHEPLAYAAVVMHREGLVLAPAQLSFAQANLDGINCKETVEGEECPTHPIKKETEKAWTSLDKESMDAHTFPETPVGVQLARLASIELHCRDRRSKAAADLAALQG